MVDNINQKQENIGISWYILILLSFTLTVLATFVPYLLKAKYEIGEIAKKNVVAKHDIRIIDQVETKKLQEMARMRVIPKFKENNSFEKSSIKDFNNLLISLSVLQNNGIIPFDQKLKINPTIHSNCLICRDSELPKATELLLAGQKDKDKTLIENLISSQRKFVQANHYDNNLIQIACFLEPKNLDSYRNTMSKSFGRILKGFQRFAGGNRLKWLPPIIEFLPDDWPQDLRTASGMLICSVLQPNFTVDDEKTIELFDQAQNSVQPVYINIKAGDIAIKKGSKITQRELAIINSLNGETIKFGPYFALVFVSTLAAFIICGISIITFNRKLIYQKNALALISTTVIGCLLLTGILSHKYCEFSPIPAMVIILNIFFGRTLAIIILLCFSMLLVTAQSLDLISIISLTLASFGGLLAYNKKNRNSMVFTALIAGSVEGLSEIILLKIAEPYLNTSFLATQFVFGCAGGFLSCILAYGLLPILENVFDLLTPEKIAQLAETDQPLLRQLEELAPGTYQHSLAVANLAQAGALACQADPNLARAGALYHDIGKMVKAQFFIENQLGSENPHDSLTPEQSREKVLNHVTDGLELAKKYKLPKAICDFIPMHQGTSLMAYFYHKACLRDGQENVDSNSYRYPGPKPNTKETAIVMLADVSEAATHALNNPSEEEIKEVIHQVFQNRIEDGQFNETELTKDELVKIEAAFVRVWRTLHHERLKYPATSTGKMAIYKSKE